MSLITINNLKWLSTVLILTGILLTNLNNYPINIFIHGLGAILIETQCLVRRYPQKDQVQFY